MNASFPQAFAKLLIHEGGFVNHPSDPGGMTNLGVTKAVWEDWVEHPVFEADMRALTPALVEPLYREKYWDRIKGNNLPAGVDYCVLDAAVNSGVRRAVRWLQGTVGAVPDGSIGPHTLGAVAAKPATELIQEYSAQRLKFLQGLPTWDIFGKGWSRRVKEVEQVALEMVQTSPPSTIRA
jgi:lysozyme family protein